MSLNARPPPRPQVRSIAHSGAVGDARISAIAHRGYHAPRPNAITPSMSALQLHFPPDLHYLLEHQVWARLQDTRVITR